MAVSKRKPRSARSSSARRSSKPRKNPARPLLMHPAQMGNPKVGHLQSRTVLAIEYQHVASAQRKPYRHDFDSRDVCMYLMPDGSISIRHAKGKRLWDDYVVHDSE